MLRFYGAYWFNLEKMVDAFRNYQWLFVVMMPFGLIMLDLQGYYQSPSNKTVWRAFVQILRAMVGLTIMAAVRFFCGSLGLDLKILLHTISRGFGAK